MLLQLLLKTSTVRMTSFYQRELPEARSIPNDFEYRLPSTFHPPMAEQARQGWLFELVKVTALTLIREADTHCKTLRTEQRS